jgi:hypothetical protein
MWILVMSKSENAVFGMAKMMRMTRMTRMTRMVRMVCLWCWFCFLTERVLVRFFVFLKNETSVSGNQSHLLQQVVNILLDLNQPKSSKSCDHYTP